MINAIKSEHIVAKGDAQNYCQKLIVSRIYLNFKWMQFEFIWKIGQYGEENQRQEDQVWSQSMTACICHQHRPFHSWQCHPQFPFLLFQVLPVIWSSWALKRNRFSDCSHISRTISNEYFRGTPTHYIKIIWYQLTGRFL